MIRKKQVNGDVRMEITITQAENLLSATNALQNDDLLL